MVMSAMTFGMAHSSRQFSRLFDDESVTDSSLSTDVPMSGARPRSDSSAGRGARCSRLTRPSFGLPERLRNCVELRAPSIGDGRSLDALQRQQVDGPLKLI